MADSFSEEVLNQLGNACRNGEVETLQKLFNEGSPEVYCDAMYKHIPLLTWAVKGGHIEVMDFLIENRADVRNFFSFFWFRVFSFFPSNNFPFEFFFFLR